MGQPCQSLNLFIKAVVELINVEGRTLVFFIDFVRYNTEGSLEWCGLNTFCNRRTFLLSFYIQKCTSTCPGVSISCVTLDKAFVS